MRRAGVTQRLKVFGRSFQSFASSSTTRFLDSGIFGFLGLVNFISYMYEVHWQLRIQKEERFGAQMATCLDVKRNPGLPGTCASAHLRPPIRQSWQGLPVKL